MCSAASSHWIFFGLFNPSAYSIALKESTTCAPLVTTLQQKHACFFSNLCSFHKANVPMQYILCSILNIKYALRMLCTCDRQARREHMHFEYDVFDSGPDRPDRQTSTDIDRSIFFGIPRPHKAHGKPEALMECPSLRSYLIYHDPTFDSLPSSLQAEKTSWQLLLPRCQQDRKSQVGAFLT